MPFVASAAATGILATYLFNPQFGVVNNVLRVLGLPQQGWLEDPAQAMVVHRDHVAVGSGRASPR